MENSQNFSSESKYDLSTLWPTYTFKPYEGTKLKKNTCNVEKNMQLLLYFENSKVVLVL
jgi:hypothetical protein